MQKAVNVTKVIKARLKRAKGSKETDNLIPRINPGASLININAWEIIDLKPDECGEKKRRKYKIYNNHSLFSAGFNFSLMFFIMSKILNFLLHPLMWVFVLMVLALFLRKNKPRRIFLILATFCLAGFGNEPLADYFTDRWEYPAVSLESVEHHDYGIVLSGMGAYHESSESFRFYDESDRFIQAVTLYKEGKLDTLILTGGSGRLIGNKHREAKYLKEYLLQWGISEKDVWVETASRNTYENARNTVEQYHDPGSNYLLITSAFHMRRALACFQNQGLNPDVFPTGPNKEHPTRDLVYYVLPNVQAFEKWNILFKEWVGYIAYNIMGYL